jgi:hypothetical protein
VVFHLLSSISSHFLAFCPVLDTGPEGEGTSQCCRGTLLLTGEGTGAREAAPSSDARGHSWATILRRVLRHLHLPTLSLPQDTGRAARGLQCPSHCPG